MCPLSTRHPLKWKLRLSTTPPSRSMWPLSTVRPLKRKLRLSTTYPSRNTCPLGTRHPPKRRLWLSTTHPSRNMCPLSARHPLKWKFRLGTTPLSKRMLRWRSTTFNRLKVLWLKLHPFRNKKYTPRNNPRQKPSQPKRVTLYLPSLRNLTKAPRSNPRLLQTGTTKILLPKRSGQRRENDWAPPQFDGARLPKGREFHLGDRRTQLTR